MYVHVYYVLRLKKDKGSYIDPPLSLFMFVLKAWTEEHMGLVFSYESFTIITIHTYNIINILEYLYGGLHYIPGSIFCIWSYRGV